MIGLAIRIAQRMQIHNDAACEACGVLEGEMRRRLWWALVLFDARVCELADFKSGSMTPTWDCHVPLNVNDTDLRPETKIPPTIHETPTEAIFIVVHSEIGDFIRNTTVHLDFTAPDLKPIAKFAEPKHIPEDGRIHNLERILEKKYLRFCDPEVPLHFITIWRTRALLSKAYLMEVYSRFSNSGFSGPSAETELDTVIGHALRMIECDTKIISTEMVAPFRWMAHYHFPFPAYVLLVKDLRRRPFSNNADRAWSTMSDNCDVRIDSAFQENGPFFNLFSKLILHAWWARETKCAQLGIPAVPPRIVHKLRSAVERREQNVETSLKPGSALDERTAADVIPPTSSFLSLGFEDGPGQNDLDIDMNQFGWPAVDWGFGQQCSW